MITVLLLIHIMVAVGLVGVVLLQRSEGGALGIGGGGGGFMTGRSAGNALTKTTAVPHPLDSSGPARCAAFDPEPNRRRWGRRTRPASDPRRTNAGCPRHTSCSFGPAGAAVAIAAAKDSRA
jgi:protein translocase SecG subunit